MNAPCTIEPGIVTEVPLELIDFDPEQPRKDVDPEYISALADDIRATRVKQPITLRANPSAPGRYLIKYGECRYRASVEAERGTIPCLLDAEPDGSDDPLTRLIDQVKENHLRKDLNAIEWADVLRRMRDDHGKKSAKQIEQTLKSHGITNMGESYIKNTIRLNELPDWGKDLIKSGKFTPAHGKYLLPAMASERVSAAVAAKIAKSESMTTVELEKKIADAYRSEHEVLEKHYTKFDFTTECDGCQKKRRINGGYDGAVTYCLDDACHAAKTSLAKKAAESKKAETVALTADENGVVDIATAYADGAIERDQYAFLSKAKFNPKKDGCSTCLNMKQATYYGQKGPACFSVACFHQKQSAASRAEGRREKLEAYLDAWLRRHIIANRLAGNTTLCLNLVGYMALKLPAGKLQYGMGADLSQSSTSKPVDSVIESTGLIDIVTVLERGAMGHIEQIAAAGIDMLNRGSLRALAHHLEVEVQGPFASDEEFLKLFDKDGLIDLLKITCARDEDALRRETMGSLRDRCRDDAEGIWVPPVVAKLFAAGKPRKKKEANVSQETDGSSGEETGDE
jgi:ParB/RepB/Spo0J family partition protein